MIWLGCLSFQNLNTILMLWFCVCDKLKKKYDYFYYFFLGIQSEMCPFGENVSSLVFSSPLPVQVTNQLFCCLQVRPLSVGSLSIPGSWWSRGAAASYWRAWGSSRRSCRPPWRRRRSRKRRTTNSARLTTYVHFYVFLCVCSLMTASTLLDPPVHMTSFNMLICF